MLPVEIGLEMYGEKEVVLPFFTGHVARGLLLHVVSQVDPSASGLLHELNTAKPYSVTPLRFKSRARHACMVQEMHGKIPNKGN